MKGALALLVLLLMARWAERAVLSVVSPQMRRLWTATMPSTERKASCTTEKLMLRGIPGIKMKIIGGSILVTAESLLIFHINLFKRYYTVYHPLEGRGFVCLVFDTAIVMVPNQTHESATSKRMIIGVRHRVYRISQQDYCSPPPSGTNLP